MKNDMENKDWLNEFDELRKVNPNNPFTVPSGYFSDLTARITSLKNIVDFDTPTGGFTTPQNYFDDLSGNIERRIVVESAINVEDTGFKVPDGYFDELSANIQSRIAIEEAMGEDAGFAVPQGYFENLQEQITARIAVEEALSTSTNDDFAVPAGYFDKLNAAILAKTVNAPAEVITEPVQRRSIVRRMFASSAYKYAVAACVMVVAGVTFMFNQDKTTAESQPYTVSTLHDRLLNIPVSEIKNYVEQNLDAGEAQVTLTSQNVSDEEILDYIDTEL